MSIYSVLSEELENSRRMKSDYEAALQRLPVGSLIKKKINGHEYFYIVKRIQGKVQFEYIGKTVSDETKSLYADAKQKRVLYRKHLSQVKKQIKFLEGALRGKSA
ncbi:MAG: hypothetical protein K9N11_01335 [Lentisphaeria bacterium]|nr:hypothetical protein [Candidatus Neomarinimicrobiota bacterium]MCF7841471.1 hypothetical protein [Lentisphaeria bacterium]